MHNYRMLTEQSELDMHLLPVLRKNGSEIPSPGCYVAAVEFDEGGDVVAYQMLQNAVFLEGLWSREKSANLLRLYRMANDFAYRKFGVESLLTLTRQDETGNRIGRIAEKLGFTKMHWSIYRRKVCH